ERARREAELHRLEGPPGDVPGREAECELLGIATLQAVHAAGDVTAAGARRRSREQLVDRALCIAAAGDELRDVGGPPARATHGASRSARRCPRARPPRPRA